MLRTSLYAATAVMIALPTVAQDTSPDPAATSDEVPHPPSREELAWNTFHVMDGGLLPPEGRSTLMLLAWHAAMANLCADIVLDHDRFGRAYATLEHADAASLTSAEHAYFRHHLSVNFGVATGILLAEMAGSHEEVAANCEAARIYATEVSVGQIYFDVLPSFEETLQDAAADEGVGRAGTETEEVSE